MIYRLHIDLTVKEKEVMVFMAQQSQDRELPYSSETNLS